MSDLLTRAEYAAIADGLDLPARARWPLDTTGPGLLGAGRKGPKA